VLGVGHSLGGYLTMLAALERPELFRAIVVLDSPVIGTWAGRAFGLVKRFGLVDRVTPAGATRDRRSHWKSARKPTSISTGARSSATSIRTACATT